MWGGRRLTAVLARWHRFGLPGRRIHITLCVVKCDGRDLATSPDDESTNRRKDEANEKQGRQHRLWREDWLPCLESLLLKCSI